MVVVLELSLLACDKFMQVLSGKYTLRFAVGAPLTEERHVNEALKVLQDKATSLLQTL